MVRKEIDMMPRSLALTMLAGAVLGGSFWVALIAVIVR
jgi:hypothetical protein